MSDLSMDQEVIHRLKSACERGLVEMPQLAAPDGTISVRIADVLHLCSVASHRSAAGNTGSGA